MAGSVKVRCKCRMFHNNKKKHDGDHRLKTREETIDQVQVCFRLNFFESAKIFDPGIMVQVRAKKIN
jgi:hypothetical protein